MEIFENILLMLSAVFLSNVLSRFVPNVAIPLIQVFLGVCLTIPLAANDHLIEISPELFLLLFLAPLLFNDGTNADKVSFWKYRKSILSLSVGLVFITVGILGAFIHWLLPQVPLAACFALAAALAPTDAVAVSALAEKLKIPSKMMHTLEGESLINDASGLVSFQFAVAALLTGTFSFVNAGTSFLMLSIGGILLGLVMTALKIKVMSLLRSAGIENAVSFILMELLLPFFIFVTAEKIGVNGILAVVSGGMLHSFSYRKLDPGIAQLNLLSRNTWAVLTFSLNGLVFILLGTQLPHIIRTIWLSNKVSNVTVFLYIFAITAILLAIRFIWIWLARNFDDTKVAPGERLKQALLYTVSGVRGTITLVSALSLPFVLSGNQDFVARDLLVFIAAGVITVTLLLANFTMPLLAPKKAEALGESDTEIEADILREVINKLKSYQTDENKQEVAGVISMYNDRILTLNNFFDNNEENRKIRALVMQWQYENILHMLYKREITMQAAYPTLRRLKKRLYGLTKKKEYKSNLFYDRAFRKNLRALNILPLTFEERRKQRYKIIRSNNTYIIEQLEKLPANDFSQDLIDRYIFTYERIGNENRNFSSESLQEWMDVAIQEERKLIQQYFETGKIDRAEMKKFRDNVLALENSSSFTN